MPDIRDIRPGDPAGREALERLTEFIHQSIMHLLAVSNGRRDEIRIYLPAPAERALQYYFRELGINYVGSEPISILEGIRVDREYPALEVLVAYKKAAEYEGRTDHRLSYRFDLRTMEAVPE